MKKRKVVCFTGSRPNNLYGYDLNAPQYQPLKDKLKDAIIAECDTVDGFKDKSVQTISGGALGVDTLAFNIVAEIIAESKYDLINTIAVPFKNQPTAWPQTSQDEYWDMLNRADAIFYVDELNGAPNPGLYAREKLMDRNKWMVDNSDVVIAVYRKDKINESRGTKHCINYALSKGKEVVKIEL